MSVFFCWSTITSAIHHIFEKLRKHGVISVEMLGALKRMRKFRNVLVHRYGIVDDRKVFANIQANLSDFMRFRKAVARFLRAFR
ncbi:MAG: DUF86 domain-containing protein [Candidatus Aenigmarchaeota archaeon]|nr:DUF86 domain-containing protein [Candidatus Aenigmarchaeota archaeon]